MRHSACPAGGERKMDSNSFENIKRAVKERNFKNEKLDALKTTLACSYGYLSAEQVAQLLPEFSFDDDKEKAVEVCAPRMYSITCEQAATILRGFSFDKSKIKALEVIACHITDNNLGALESALNFASDRNRAREILMNRSQPGLPRQPGVYPGAGPLPGGFPGVVPQAGGYPAPAPYAQPSPYPGQSPYPGAGPYGGMCPPGQPPYAPAGQGMTPPQYPTGTVPPPTSQFPGGALGAMQGMMDATADAMMKGMNDMFGANPRQGQQYPPQGGYYPSPGGYPQPGYPYQPPK